MHPDNDSPDAATASLDTPMTSAPAADTDVANLRDLGGLHTADGRQLAGRRLYRSSHLARLGLRQAEALGLRTVVDLRGVQERAALPPANLGSQVRQLHLAIEPSAVARLKALRDTGLATDESTVVEIMHGVYRRLVRERAPVYAALLRELQQPAAYPLLFHCTAGKDRTGVAAALVLLALDVPAADIEQDYLLSNLHWRPGDMPGGTLSAGWVALARVRADYLHTALQAMHEGWGSPQAYLERALGLDGTARAALRQQLLA